MTRSHKRVARRVLPAGGPAATSPDVTGVFPQFAVNVPVNRHDLAVPATEVLVAR